MPIEVEGPDGATIEFPDGTDPATIQGVMGKRYGGPKSAPAAPPPAREAPVQRAAAPAKAPWYAGAPTKPLAGSGGTGFMDRAAQIGDQLYRSYAGGAVDLADAATGLINRPMNAILDAVNAPPEMRIPVDGVGPKVAQPVGLGGQLARTLAPFVAGGAGLEAGITRMAPKLVARAPIATNIVAGAPIDAAMAHGQDKNLSNMVQDATGVTLPTARVAGENEGVAAVKDMVEGGALGAVIGAAAKYFTRGPSAMPGTPAAMEEEAAIQEAVADPVIRAQLEASGITPETSPRYGEFVARAEAQTAPPSNVAPEDVPVEGLRPAYTPAEEPIPPPQALEPPVEPAPVAAAPVQQPLPAAGIPATEPNQALTPTPVSLVEQSVKDTMGVEPEQFRALPEAAQTELVKAAETKKTPAPAVSSELEVPARTVEPPAPKGKLRADEAGGTTFYHGSPRTDLTEFKPTPREGTMGASPVVSMSTNRKFAEGYAEGGRVYNTEIEDRALGDFRKPEDAQKVIDFYTREEGPLSADDVAGIKHGEWRFWENPKLWDEQQWDGAWNRELQGRSDSEAINVSLRNGDGVTTLPDNAPIKTAAEAGDSIPTSTAAAGGGPPKLEVAPQTVESQAAKLGDELPVGAAKIDDPEAPKPTKLYSNPADPEAVKELLLDPATKAVKREIDSIKTDFEQIKRDFKGLSESASPAKAAGAVAAAVRKVWWSNTASIQYLAKKHPNIPEVREVADMIGTDPGRGRVVAQTYERATQMRSMGMANRLKNVLGEKPNEAVESKVADILSGRSRGVTGTKEETTAKRVRVLLDEQHDYMVKAGLDVGYVKGSYFPRVLDDDAVMKNPAGFKESAGELYFRMGMSPEEAKAAADGWYSRILGVTDGAYSKGLPASKATKGRTLPADADKIMAEFYQKDPRKTLTDYFRQTSQAAEFARRFGKNGEVIEEKFNAMLKKGMDPKMVEDVRAHFESAAGLLYRTRPARGAEALSWIQTAGVLRLLPRAVISSAVEALAAGVRAHDVGAGFKALADSYATVFGMRGKDDVAQAAEFLGIVGNAMNDLVLSAQFGGEVSGLAQQKLLSRFFQVTQLHQITEAQRTAAARVGQGMIRTLLQDLDGKRAQSAKRLLAELGMDEAGARSVGQWFAANDGKIPLGDLMGDKKEALLYRTALQRFVDESIQNPTAADRPQWANHPYGRLAYGITSFMFSFTRNVLVRTARETAEGVLGKGYTLEDRARLLTPAIGLAVLTAAQSQVSEFRDALLNPKAQGERSDTQKLVTNLSRGGMFGNADPFINIAMSARYNRDLTSTLTGPYLTAYLDSISKMTVGLIPKELGGPNTPNTNNAEWQASKAAYEAIAAPTIAAVASYMPGGPMLKVGYGAGLVGLTSPGASRAFADAVAGERDVKPGGRKADTDVESFDIKLDDESNFSDTPGENQEGK